MNHFDAETAINPVGDDVWEAHLSGAWDIGTNSNGGYALSPVLRALKSISGQPDPITVTTHFLRPAQGDTPARIHGEVIRRGRTTATARGSLEQEGKQRLVMLAAFGDLEQRVGTGPELGLPPPDLPPVEQCVPRSSDEQGVELPLLSRIEAMLHPDHAVAGKNERAIVEGWIRFPDRSDPTTLSLPFFCDCFPPSLFSRVGMTGWVPTIELTVHVRRRPAAGWLRARFECDDLHQGRMVESGALWDSTGALVARSRQVGLLLSRDP